MSLLTHQQQQHQPIYQKHRKEYSYKDYPNNSKYQQKNLNENKKQQCFTTRQSQYQLDSSYNLNNFKPMHKYQQSDIYQYQSRVATFNHINNHHQKEFQRDPITDQRIQEIKRKYNTPSRKLNSQYNSQTSEYSFSSKKKDININTSSNQTSNNIDNNNNNHKDNQQLNNNSYKRKDVMERLKDYQGFKQNKRNGQSIYCNFNNRSISSSMIGGNVMSISNSSSLNNNYLGTQQRQYKTPSAFNKDYTNYCYKTQDQEAVLRRIKQLKNTISGNNNINNNNNNSGLFKDPLTQNNYMKNTINNKIGYFGDDLINKKINNNSEVQNKTNKILNTNKNTNTNTNTNINTNININTNTNINTTCQYQPRVQNIQKINTKIKSILECLNQNQKQHYLNKLDKFNEDYNVNNHQNNQSFQKKYQKKTTFNNYFKDFKENHQSPKKEKENMKDQLKQRYDRYQRSYQKQNFQQSKTLNKQQENIKDKYKNQNTDYYYHHHHHLQNKIPTPNHQRHSSESDFQINKKDDKSLKDINVPFFNSKNIKKEDLKSDSNQVSSSFNLTCNNLRGQIKKVHNDKQINPTKSYIQFPKSSFQDDNSQDKSNKRDNSSKNFDEQIKKIQSKMKNYEEEKKKLNIDFKEVPKENVSIPQRPKSSVGIKDQFIQKKERIFSFNDAQVNNSANSSNNKNASHSNKSIYDTRSIPSTSTHKTFEKPPLPTKSNQKQQFYRKRASLSSAKQSINTPPSTNNNKNSNNNGFQLKLFQCQVSQPKHQIQYRKDSQQQIELKNKLTNGIEERRKMLKQNEIQTNNSSNSSNNVSRRFVDLLSHQAKLDQEFRNAKLWLESIREQTKWQSLRKQLKIYQINMTIQEIKKLFLSNEQQNNPFFTAFQCKQNFNSLAEKYYSSKKNWQKNLLGSFNRQQLSKQKFYQQKIDLQKKGYYVLQDLVRLLNMETGTFFRNRDLYLIYQRLTNGNKGTYESLVNSLTNKAW